jgi:hypothetical protein
VREGERVRERERGGSKKERKSERSESVRERVVKR